MIAKNDHSTENTLSDEKALLSIGEVSELTGVNTVTLRAWQRRYGLLKPQRTPKGHRMYTRQDVAVIENILKWLDRGVPVGQVKALLNDETFTPKTSPNAEIAREADKLKKAVMDFDVLSVNRQLSELTRHYPISVLEKNLFGPLTDFFSEQKSDVIGLCLSTWLTMLRHELLRCFQLGQKSSSKRRCVLVSTSLNDLHLFYGQALNYQAKGYAVTIIEGLDSNLFSLVKTIKSSNVTELFIFSEVALSASMKRDIVIIVDTGAVSVSLLGKCRVIHSDLFTNLNTQHVDKAVRKDVTSDSSASTKEKSEREQFQ
ncbi:MerR family transcriptional regulator [Enterovibrio norvegicus]|uniref:MerR family transcriptional regulator n=1 Tax=Enterovibrio norvegicus TaxID=188144 RepID=A0ABV4KVH5_9GAMM|nr:MerR family transcriptional regulator [Enterovibrio norvegicus]